MNGKSVIEVPLANQTPLLDRNNLVNTVRKWGDVSTDGLLDAKCQIFTDPHIEGLIGYRIEGGNAVVFGDPVCATDNKSRLAKAFQQFCRDQKIGVVYLR